MALVENHLLCRYFYGHTLKLGLTSIQTLNHGLSSKAWVKLFGLVRIPTSDCTLCPRLLLVPLLEFDLSFPKFPEH